MKIINLLVLFLIVISSINSHRRKNKRRRINENKTQSEIQNGETGKLPVEPKCYKDKGLAFIPQVERRKQLFLCTYRFLLETLNIQSPDDCLHKIAGMHNGTGIEKTVLALIELVETGKVTKHKNLLNICTDDSFLEKQILENNKTIRKVVNVFVRPHIRRLLRKSKKVKKSKK